MRWSLIHHWKSCLSSSSAQKAETLPATAAASNIFTTNGASQSQRNNRVPEESTASEDQDETDLITISVNNESTTTLKRWSVGSTSNSEGDYSKVIVQFGNEFDVNLEKILDWENCQGTMLIQNGIEPCAAAVPENVNVNEQQNSKRSSIHLRCSEVSDEHARNNGNVHFASDNNNLVQAEAMISNPDLENIESEMNPWTIVTITEERSTSPAEMDKWRVLFNRYDLEGFSEILWTDFFNIALHSAHFISCVEPGKLEVLRDLAREKILKNNALEESSEMKSATSAITFQHFVNIMSGKRSRSFKCAVHHRDREVSSENDFHMQPTLNNLNQEMSSTCTGSRRQRVARRIADEFLTDARDRKYFVEQYNYCSPPPIFIPVLILLQVGLFAYYTIYHASNTDSIKTISYFRTPGISGFVYRPDKKEEVWRFLFYALLHAGWPHFLFNLIVQITICLPLEMIHGTLRIFFIYAVGVIGSSLTTSIFDPNANLIGASGGVYALLAAHLANVLLNYSQMLKFGIVKLVVILLAASVDVGITIYNHYSSIFPSILDLDVDDDEFTIMTRQELAPISYFGHITGAIIGLNVGLVVLRNFEQSLHQQLIWWFTLSIFGTWALFTIMINIFRTNNLIL